MQWWGRVIRVSVVGDLTGLTALTLRRKQCVDLGIQHLSRQKGEGRRGWSVKQIQPTKK